MLPLGKLGLPVLELVIIHLRTSGIKKFILLIGFKGHQIESYFGDGSNFGVDIKYVYDSLDFPGNGGAILNCLSLIDTVDILVYYTDILTNLNFSALIDFHIDGGFTGTLVLDNGWKSSTVEVKFGLGSVVKSFEFSSDKINVNTGICIIQTGALSIVMSELNKMEGYSFGDPIDFYGSIIPILISELSIKLVFYRRLVGGFGYVGKI